MTESMIKRLGAFTDRRAFLRRGSSTAVGAAAVLVGVNVSEASGHESRSHGCNLCRSPSSCNYTCAWCWWGSCHTNVGGSSHHQTQCCEGYSNYPGCTGGCTSSLACSFYGGQRGC